jgi:hypothetical protein
MVNHHNFTGLIVGLKKIDIKSRRDFRFSPALFSTLKKLHTILYSKYRHIFAIDIIPYICFLMPNCAFLLPQLFQAMDDSC